MIKLDSKVENSYDITYVAHEHRPISGGINTAVGQNEGSLVRSQLNLIREEPLFFAVVLVY